VLADISAGPLVLVGHSFGGRVATVVAATQSERVRALVLTGVPLVRRESPHRSPLAYRMVRALRRRGLISDARMEVARQKYGSTDYRRATGLLRDIVVASVNESYEVELSRIGVPVALVWGENDHEVPVEVARRALALLSNSADATLDVVLDTGHFVPTERPAALVAHAQRLVVGT